MFYSCKIQDDCSINFNHLFEDSPGWRESHNAPTTEVRQNRNAMISSEEEHVAPLCIMALAIEERPLFVAELERLTPVLYQPIPAPTELLDEALWEECFAMAEQVECSPIVMFDR